MNMEDIVRWLNEETSCYAEEQTETCILVDGVLYVNEIKELARKVEEL